MNKKYIVALIATLFIFGSYFFPRQAEVNFGAVSSAGVINNVTSWSSLTTSLTSTSTSILNAGASDRAVIATYADCSTLGNSFTYTTGAGLASLTLQAATTSVSSLGLQGNTNYINNTTISTSSALFYSATSTEGVLIYTSRIWPVNTYLTFETNATNTASCAFGAEWMPL